MRRSKENQEMEKCPRTSNRRKLLPHLGLQVKGRECLQNPDRAVGAALALGASSLTGAEVLKGCSLENKSSSFTFPCLLISCWHSLI
jgi:hypothetical protein